MNLFDGFVRLICMFFMFWFCFNYEWTDLWLESWICFS